MRGQYVYYCNGKRADIAETWEISPAPPGRIIRSQRLASGTTLSVHAVETDGHLTQFDVRYRTDADDIQADYALQEQAIHLQRTQNGRTIQHQVSLSSVFIAAPLLRVFMGAVILRLAQFNAPALVLVPWLFNPAQTGRLLMPHFDTRRAVLLARHPDADLYQYLGEQYDEDARFWVNASGLLTRYTWQQGNQHWDVRLHAA